MLENQSSSEPTMNRAEIAIKNVNYGFVDSNSSKYSRYKRWLVLFIIFAVVVLIFRTCVLSKFDSQKIDTSKDTETPPVLTEQPKISENSVKPIIPNEVKKLTTISDNSTNISNDTTPKFQMVRIGDFGSLIITGTYKPNTSVTVFANTLNLGTEKTNKYGEFAFTPKTKLKPGNYVLTISSGEKDNIVYSKDNVFIYIADNQSAKSSVSFLMTDNGTQILQGPSNDNGDLILSKIDYLPNERVLVTGHSVPRLYVSLKLNDISLGTTRVSDTGTFGLGTDIGTLKYDTEYTLTAILKDSSGNIVSELSKSFEFPKWEEKQNVSYTVRKNDTLWLISRYHYGKGSMYSLIFDKNNDKIKNPDLIYPKQVFEIPMFDNNGNKIKG